MRHEIWQIADSMVREPSLPDFPLPSNHAPYFVGEAPFYELNRVLDCYVRGRSNEKMNVLGH